MASERSGGSHRIRCGRQYDQTAHHQPTNATHLYALMGDPASQAVLGGGSVEEAKENHPAKGGRKK